MTIRRSHSWSLHQHNIRTRHRKNSLDVDDALRKNQGVYHPLMLGNIRLLKIRPGSGNEPLHGELEIVALSTGPSYQAISYCWGKKAAYDTLYISHQPIPITKSLSGALRRFRSQSHSVYLWADAICINQKDKMEKAVQIQHMSIIYKQAEGVLIWLGEHQPQDAKAFWTLHWLASLGRRYFDDEYNRVDMDASFKLLQKPAETLVDFRSNLACHCCGARFNWTSGSPVGRLDEAINAIKTILNLPWFTRLWVVQENAVAVQARLYVGQHCIPWAELNLAIQIVYHRNIMRKSNRISQEKCVTRAYEITELFNRYHDVKASNGPQRGESYLLDVLMNTSHLECELVEDRLYSIQAVAFIENTCFNYHIGQPVSELWKRLAAYLVQRPTPWDFCTTGETVCASFVLTMAGLQRRDCNNIANLPSWVPDMACIDDVVRRKYEYAWWNSRNSSAGGFKRRFWADVDLKSWALYVRGGAISRIERMSDNTHFPPSTHNGGRHDLHAYNYQDLELRLVPWYLQCFHFAYERVKNIEVNAEWYDFVVLLNQGYVLSFPGTRAEYRMKPEPRERYLRLFRYLLDVMEPEHTDAGRPAGLDADTMLDNLEMLITTPQSRFQFDVSRVLAWTSDGRVGWVPQNSQEGDLVVLMEGAPEPHVVRESDSGDGLYTLIGDAYIYGVMHGEAWMYGRDMSSWEFGIK